MPIAEGVFRRTGVNTYDNSVPMSLNPGIYELHVQYSDFFVAGQPGHAEAIGLFDTRNSDRSPPELKRFEVLADGLWTDAVPPGGAQVLFTLADDFKNAIGAVALFYDTGDGRVSLTLTPQGGNAWGATIPTHESPRVVPPVIATLELMAEDLAGNRLTFRVGLPLDPGPHIFTDGFESGGFSAWSSVRTP